MRWIRTIGVILLLLMAAEVAAQRRDTLHRVSNQYLVHESEDSLVEARNRRLYDSLSSKAKRRTVPRLLHDLFVIGRRDTSSTGAVVDQSRLFQRYHGRTIDAVEILRQPVFDTAGNWLERLGNKVHVQTRERVIRRDLLFEAGDTLDPEELVRTMQLLRSRSYIADVEVELRPDSLDSTRLKLCVMVRDRWTITADMDFRSEGRTQLSLTDYNILGWGTRLSVKTQFDRRDLSYGGNIFVYEIPNIGGSFYNARFSAGRNFNESELNLVLSKPMIQPTDYELGISYSRDKSRFDPSTPQHPNWDSVALYRVHLYNLWGGRSHYLSGVQSSIYWMAHFQRARFTLRPAVEEQSHSVFHDHDELLLSLGLYRERFYTANMIYGYGTREYIPTGYRAEIAGGYRWGEFRNDYYLGIRLQGGRFAKIGYLYGGAGVGSYISPHNGSWHRSTADIDLRWFSNLYTVGRSARSRLRQFLSLNYTQGWNRDEGYGEQLVFTSTDGIRALNEDLWGTSRIVLNTETVLFSPYQPLGVRLTFFGFADFGAIGYSPNIFRNPFFTSLGVGIRFRNERLIFNAVQIQLGIVFGKGGLRDTRWVEASNQSNLDKFRYLPTRPEVIDFD